MCVWLNLLYLFSDQVLRNQLQIIVVLNDMYLHTQNIDKWKFQRGLIPNEQKIIFVRLIFVVGTDHEIYLTMKISRSTVYTCACV